MGNSSSWLSYRVTRRTDNKIHDGDLVVVNGAVPVQCGQVKAVIKWYELMAVVQLFREVSYGERVESQHMEDLRKLRVNEDMAVFKPLKELRRCSIYIITENVKLDEVTLTPGTVVAHHSDTVLMNLSSGLIITGAKRWHNRNDKFSDVAYQHVATLLRVEDRARRLMAFRSNILQAQTGSAVMVMRDRQPPVQGLYQRRLPSGLLEVKVNGQMRHITVDRVYMAEGAPKFLDAAAWQEIGARRGDLVHVPSCAHSPFCVLRDLVDLPWKDSSRHAAVEPIEPGGEGPPQLPDNLMYALRDRGVRTEQIQLVTADAFKKCTFFIVNDTGSLLAFKEAEDAMDVDLGRRIDAGDLPEDHRRTLVAAHLVPFLLRVTDRRLRLEAWTWGQLEVVDKQMPRRVLRVDSGSNLADANLVRTENGFVVLKKRSGKTKKVTVVEVVDKEFKPTRLEENSGFRPEDVVQITQTRPRICGILKGIIKVASGKVFAVVDTKRMQTAVGPAVPRVLQPLQVDLGVDFAYVVIRPISELRKVDEFGILLEDTPTADFRHQIGRGTLWCRETDLYRCVDRSADMPTARLRGRIKRIDVDLAMALVQTADLFLRTKLLLSGQLDGQLLRAGAAVYVREENSMTGNPETDLRLETVDEITNGKVFIRRGGSFPLEEVYSLPYIDQCKASWTRNLLGDISREDIYFRPNQLVAFHEGGRCYVGFPRWMGQVPWMDTKPRFVAVECILAPKAVLGRGDAPAAKTRTQQPADMFTDYIESHVSDDSDDFDDEDDVDDEDDGDDEDVGNEPMMEPPPARLPAEPQVPQVRMEWCYFQYVKVVAIPAERARILQEFNVTADVSVGLLCCPSLTEEDQGRTLADGSFWCRCDNSAFRLDGRGKLSKTEARRWLQEVPTASVPFVLTLDEPRIRKQVLLSRQLLGIEFEEGETVLVTSSHRTLTGNPDEDLIFEVISEIRSNAIILDTMAEPVPITKVFYRNYPQRTAEELPWARNLLTDRNKPVGIRYNIDSLVSFVENDQCHIGRVKWIGKIPWMDQLMIGVESVNVLSSDKISDPRYLHYIKVMSSPKERTRILKEKAVKKASNIYMMTADITDVKGRRISKNTVWCRRSTRLVCISEPGEIGESTSSKFFYQVPMENLPNLLGLNRSGAGDEDGDRLGPRRTQAIIHIVSHQLEDIVLEPGIELLAPKEGTATGNPDNDLQSVTIQQMLSPQGDVITTLGRQLTREQLFSKSYPERRDLPWAANLLDIPDNRPLPIGQQYPRFIDSQDPDDLDDSDAEADDDDGDLTKDEFVSFMYRGRCSVGILRWLGDIPWKDQLMTGIETTCPLLHRPDTDGRFVHYIRILDTPEDRALIIPREGVERVASVHLRTVDDDGGRRGTMWVERSTRLFCLDDDRETDSRNNMRIVGSDLAPLLLNVPDLRVRERMLLSGQLNRTRLRPQARLLAVTAAAPTGRPEDLSEVLVRELSRGHVITSEDRRLSVDQLFDVDYCHRGARAWTRNLLEDADYPQTGLQAGQLLTFMEDDFCRVGELRWMGDVPWEDQRLLVVDCLRGSPSPRRDGRCVHYVRVAEASDRARLLLRRQVEEASDFYLLAQSLGDGTQRFSRGTLWCRRADGLHCLDRAGHMEAAPNLLSVSQALVGLLKPLQPLLRARVVLSGQLQGHPVQEGQVVWRLKENSSGESDDLVEDTVTSVSDGYVHTHQGSVVTVDNIFHPEFRARGDLPWTQNLLDVSGPPVGSQFEKGDLLCYLEPINGGVCCAGTLVWMGAVPWIDQPLVGLLLMRGLPQLPGDQRYFHYKRVVDVEAPRGSVRVLPITSVRRPTSFAMLSEWVRNHRPGSLWCYNEGMPLRSMDEPGALAEDDCRHSMVPLTADQLCLLLHTEGLEKRRKALLTGQLDGVRMGGAVKLVRQPSRTTGDPEQDLQTVVLRRGPDGAPSADECAKVTAERVFTAQYFAQQPAWVTSPQAELFNADQTVRARHADRKWRQATVRWCGRPPWLDQMYVGLQTDSEDDRDGRYLEYQRLFSGDPKTAFLVPLSEIHEADIRIQRTDSMVGSSASGSVKAEPVRLAAPIPVASLAAICGPNRGIQGQNNSSFLDCLVFAMFAFTSAFDESASRARKEGDRARFEEAQRALLLGVVNPLREEKFVPSSNVVTLLQLLAKESGEKRFLTEVRDISDCIKVLFEQLLGMEPLVATGSSSEGKQQSAFMINTVMLENCTQRAPTSQLYLEYAVMTMGFHLRQRPASLILQLPRQRGGKDSSFVVPSLVLNLGQCLRDSVRKCKACPGPATAVDEKQFDDDGLASTLFCATCSQTRPDCHPLGAALAGALPSGQRQDNVLYLSAVICYDAYNYSCFARCGRPANARWVFFDSLAEPRGPGGCRPAVKPVDLPKWVVAARAQKAFDPAEFAPDQAIAERLFVRPYTLIYESAQ